MTRLRLPLLARRLAPWLLGTAAALAVVLGHGGLQDALLPAPPPATPTDAATAHRVAVLQARLDALVPARPYLVVSTTDNVFHLRRGRDELRTGRCSTGSLVQLRGEDGRQWTFETPRGRFRVLDKREKPVWVKPDWAFVEEGRPVPPAGAPERYERGALGDYALGLGDGYLIHGTLYQRQLGMAVTHGCIRLGDDDLAAAYRALPVGASVFIY